jgi:hypothetical protein
MAHVSGMQNVTVLWLDGYKEVFEDVANVASEVHQWKLTEADGSFTLIPRRAVRKIAVKGRS